MHGSIRDGKERIMGAYSIDILAVELAKPGICLPILAAVKFQC
jgi:hypothetical protein